MTLDPEIRELSPQSAVTEVAVTEAAGIPAVVDAGFRRLFGRLAELGVEPTGPPYIRYLRTGEELELELGIPAPGQPDGLPGGPFWESYVTNPREEPDSSKWITEIVQPIRTSTAH